MTVYRTVRIPESLVQDIIEMIEKYPELGYRSHSEFIIECARLKKEQLKQFLINYDHFQKEREKSNE